MTGLKVMNFEGVESMVDLVFLISFLSETMRKEDSFGNCYLQDSPAMRSVDHS